MKRHSHWPKRSTLIPFLQGAVLPIGAVSAALVFGACTQIDAFKKIADYKEWYEDYRNQIAQTKELWETEKTQLFSSLTGIDLGAVKENLEDRKDEYLGGTYASSEPPEEQALATVGDLSKGVSDGADGPVGECWRAAYGANTDFDDPDSSIRPRGSQCSSEQEQLNRLSIKASDDGGRVDPNTALESEMTRALVYGEFPPLNAIRADLSWLRDHPEVWTPLRLPSNVTDYALETVAKHSHEQQRVAAILADRGLGYVGYDRLDPQASGILADENNIRAAQAIATLGYVTESFARYPTTLYELMPAKTALRDLTPEEIDSAKEGDRKAMLEQFKHVQTEVDLIRESSKMRFERLLGVWLGNGERQQVQSLLENQR